jgi:hypothetical protein
MSTYKGSIINKELSKDNDIWIQELLFQIIVFTNEINVSYSF